MYKPDQIELRPNTVLNGKPPHNPDFWFKVYRSADFFWDFIAKRPVKAEEDTLPEGFGLKHLTALYYGAVTCVDHYIGRLVSALKTHQRSTDTVILFTSDHGDNLGSHGLFNKNELIEESIRIPLILVLPGKPDGTHNTSIASLIDVAPTLLDLAGIDTPRHMQGKSLLRKQVLNSAFIETGRAIGIRTQTHMYGTGYDEKTRRVTGSGSVLYNLDNDPFEMHNLSETPENKKIEAKLREQLLEWDRQTPWMKSR